MRFNKMAGGQILDLLVLGVLFRSPGLILAANVQCLSSTEKPIDWFIVYKLPVNEKGVTTDAFFYMDSDQLSWQLSDKTIDQTGHAVYNTLSQIYDHPDSKGMRDGTDLLYIMYNDQEKPGTDWWKATAHGHTKGVVAFDKTSGFWLIHSTPHFPPSKEEGYSWPKSAEIYGQTFLCISMATSSNLNKIGIQLQYTYPHIYDFASSTYFNETFPTMTAVLNRSHVTEAPWTSEITLTSLAGVAFHSFAKFSKFNADLYADWLAPRFEDTMYVETWQNGRNKLCSNCTGKYKVYNVADVAFNSSTVVFKETKDHAKWAVTLTSSNPWTCIGDINRQESQMTRPGGTVCFQNKAVWTNFFKLVLDYHDCQPYDNCVL